MYPVPAIPLEVQFYAGHWGRYVSICRVLWREADAKLLRVLKVFPG